MRAVHRENPSRGGDGLSDKRRTETSATTVAGGRADDQPHSEKGQEAQPLGVWRYTDKQGNPAEATGLLGCHLWHHDVVKRVAAGRLDADALIFAGLLLDRARNDTGTAYLSSRYLERMMPMRRARAARLIASFADEGLVAMRPGDTRANRAAAYTWGQPQGAQPERITIAQPAGRGTAGLPDVVRQPAGPGTAHLTMSDSALTERASAEEPHQTKVIDEIGTLGNLRKALGSRDGVVDLAWEYVGARMRHQEDAPVVDSRQALTRHIVYCYRGHPKTKQYPKGAGLPCDGPHGVEAGHKHAGEMADWEQKDRATTKRRTAPVSEPQSVAAILDDVGLQVHVTEDADAWWGSLTALEQTIVAGLDQKSNWRDRGLKPFCHNCQAAHNFDDRHEHPTIWLDERRQQLAWVLARGAGR